MKAARTVLTTSPHGEQSLSTLPALSTGYPIRNQLFRLANIGGRELILTGEELDSLADQWRAFVRSHSKPTTRKTQRTNERRNLQPRR